MAHTRRTSGVDVVFDKNSLATFHSRSSSNSSCESDRSSDSLGQRRRRARSSSFSSSSSTSSRTSSRSRSRSHPRCHRRSSRCRCDSSRRSGLGRYSRSPPRRQRAHSRSHSRSAHVRPNRDHSKSSRRWNRSRYSRPASGFSRTYRSRSRSPARSVSLSLDDKKELLEAAKVNAMKILGVENLELPESVQPTLSEQSGSEQESPEPGTRVPQLHTESFSQNNDEEPDFVPSPRLSLRGKISFSINNSVVKPTAIAPSTSKVTHRADSYESRKPYGHWVPVKLSRKKNARRY